MFRKTKGNKSRAAFMTAAVKAMLEARTKGARVLVFPGRNGVKIEQASDTFTRAVDKLGFIMRGSPTGSSVSSSTPCVMPSRLGWLRPGPIFTML